MAILNAFLFACFAFFLGALPFAVWLGNLVGYDPRQVGDHNPGAANAFLVAGWKFGLVVLILDISKAALPVGLAYQTLGWRGLWMWLIALAPSLGHAYSPFLGGQGGKAVATVMGAWIGLTLWRVPLVGVCALVIGFALLTASGWALVIAFLAVGFYLLGFEPAPLFLGVLIAQFLLLAWKYRSDLVHKPVLRPWLLKRSRVNR